MDTIKTILCSAVLVHLFLFVLSALISSYSLSFHYHSLSSASTAEQEYSSSSSTITTTKATTATAQFRSFLGDFHHPFDAINDGESASSRPLVIAHRGKIVADHECDISLITYRIDAVVFFLSILLSAVVLLILLCVLPKHNHILLLLCITCY